MNIRYQKIFIVISLMLFSVANATDGTTTSTQSTPTTLQNVNIRSGNEHVDNESMIQMHQQEEAYREKKYGKQSDVTGVIGDKGNDPLKSGNLTDSEKQLSENYVHQGLIDEKIQEGCASEEMQAACDGREVRHDFMGMDSNMVKALAKAYSMVVGAGLGGDLTKRPSGDTKTADSNNSADTGDAGKGKEGANTEKKEEKQEDYCKYIALATEVVSMFQFQTSQKNVTTQPSNQDNAQKEMLYKAARSHDERAKTAKIQRNGWGITAACYTGMLTVAQLDFNLGLKLASSYLMTAFFQNEVKNHEKYRDKVRALAEKLPGRGDCNPVTETDCYCTHPQTANDARYCAPYLHKRQIASSSIRVTCLDNHMKADPNCECSAQKTCFDQTFLKLSGPGFSNLGRSTTDPFVKMTNGELIGADGNLAALRNQGVIKNALRKFDDTLKPNGLTKDQKAIAKSMTGLGIPAKLAATLAQQKTSAKGNSFANGIGYSGGSYKPISYSGSSNKDRNNVLSFSGGSDLTNTGSRRNERSSNSRTSKRGKTKNSAGVLKFAEKATSEAGITKDKSRPIFEIISRRYQLSAPKRLELE